MTAAIAVVCILTFLHYVGAQMRGPVLSLYAASHGATPTGVGLIMGVHMVAAGIASIPFGRAADVHGRRPLMLTGLLVSLVTSLLLPLFDGQWSLLIVYGFAGLGVAAFTPAALSMVGDHAPADKVGHAFAWYSTAHYGAIAVGPFLGGLVAEWAGYRTTFVASAGGIAIALALAHSMLHGITAQPTHRPAAALCDVSRNRDVWAGWVASLSGLLIQGVVFPFFPLLAADRGLGPAAVGVVFLVLGATNTAARFPAGWLIDRTRRASLCALAGVPVASLATALLPYATTYGITLAVVAVFGTSSGIAFVGISVGLAAASNTATRGLVMGGYSTSLYLGFALGSFALGPIITRYGYDLAFVIGGAMGIVGTLVAATLGSAKGVGGQGVKSV
jgi:MFS transporter, DHA1 family, multidrug resistance protein